jgi:hypothetical protein
LAQIKNKYAASLNYEGCDYLDRMINATRRMSDMIQALLDYSRLGTRAKHLGAVDLTKVLREVEGDLEFLIQESGARIEAEHRLPSVEADSNQMRQLFQNLVGNALKFHKPGNPPLVEVSGEKANGSCRILVKDNGIDIEQDMLDKLMLLRPQLKVTIDENAWKSLWLSLADWIDSDSNAPSSGAETPYYKTLKQPYSTRNGRLRSVEELSMVKGFTPEIIAMIRPFVTVYAEQSGSYSIALSRININTAPLEVIVALDKNITKTMAQRVLEVRRRKAFKSIGELAQISGFESLVNKPNLYATTKGSVFRIKSKTTVKDSARTVEAVWRWSSATCGLR